MRDHRWLLVHAPGLVYIVWLFGSLQAGCAGGLELHDDDVHVVDDDDDDLADDDDDLDDDDDDTGDDDAGPCAAQEGAWSGTLTLTLQCWQYPQETGACALQASVSDCAITSEGTCPPTLLDLVDFFGLVDDDGAAAGTIEVDVDTFPVSGPWEGQFSADTFDGAIPWTEHGGCYLMGSWSLHPVE